MDIAERTQSEGKTIILVTQGDPDDCNRILFGLASYLLANNGQAFFRYANDQIYRKVWWYPEFDINLGQPIGPKVYGGRNLEAGF
ncbi:MAG: putative glycoside hydrolase [Pelolinea sp.]|nr:putative glycoside hydrolase [Pelolinea sp.]